MAQINWHERKDRYKRLRGIYHFLVDEKYDHLPVFAWVTSELNLVCRQLNRRRYRKTHPVRLKAGGAVRRAIKHGDLIRPDVCEQCGRKKFLDAHHESYAVEDWLKVKWLCRSCHRSLHQRKE